MVIFRIDGGFEDNIEYGTGTFVADFFSLFITGDTEYQIVELKPSLGETCPFGDDNYADNEEDFSRIEIGPDTVSSAIL